MASWYHHRFGRVVPIIMWNLWCVRNIYNAFFSSWRGDYYFTVCWSPLTDLHWLLTTARGHGFRRVACFSDSITKIDMVKEILITLICNNTFLIWIDYSYLYLFGYGLEYCSLQHTLKATGRKLMCGCFS